MKQIEREAILQALVWADGNMTTAATLLGVAAKALRYKVRWYMRFHCH